MKEKATLPSSKLIEIVEPELLVNKHILDCCCGSKMFWFNKDHPNVFFTDLRELETTLCDGRNLKIKPDVKADFRKLPFRDETFNMVVYDPPHMNKLGKDSWMAQKYGVLFSTWETDIKCGFDEAMRVLKPYGTLIFKWNEIQITTSKILEVIECEPLFGHPSGKHGRTKWFTFIKNVSNQKLEQ